MGTLLHDEKKRPPTGFTMIEVIAVIAVLAFLAVMGAMAFQPDQEDLSSALNTFRANLRFAQALAVAQSHLTQEDPTDKTVIWGLSCGSSSYQLQVQGANQNYINLPGSSDATITLPGGVTFSGQTDIHFNYRGQPVDSSEKEITEDTIISLKTDNKTQTVTVVADTGFVQ